MRRRTRRGRMISLGLMFVIYSAYSATINVYSASINETPLDAADAKVKDFDAVLSETSSADDAINGILSTKSSVTTSLDVDESTSESISTTSTTTKPPITEHRGRYRPKRNCTPPAIDQFPPTILPPAFREHGGLIIHIFIAIFTFLGLAIVCDDYFVASLDRICEELRLSPDVAGATFMAAGSSAPELGTVIIGVFFAKDDIGVSGVIGSAVFNIMFVISMCALCSGTVCHLNWWPLIRDCFFYSLSIIVMLIIMLNDFISWYEALTMILCYVFYCIVLHFNTPLEKWAYTWKLPIKLPTKEEQSALVTFKNVPEVTYSHANGADSSTVQSPDQQQSPPQQQQQAQPQYQGYNETTDWDPNAAWDESGSRVPQPSAAQTSVSVSSNYGAYPPTTTDSWNPDASWDQGQQNYGYATGAGDQSDQSGIADGTVSGVDQSDGVQTTNKVGAAPAADFYKSKDPKASQIPANPLLRPTEGGPIALITWRVCYPIHYACQKTMPDCRTEKYRNWYGLTFVMSMVWISFYSYLMVWMITIIGTTLGIPDTVMGLTFVAAGVSIPDALSSIAVIKEGHGDMAVSNAVGSNVFDILVCLGLPWLIQTTILDPGGHVNVISKGLTYSTLSLLSTVVFLILSVHLNGWKLDRRLGIILMVWYFLFIALALMYELNVFGNFNPPQCPSDY